MSFRVVRQSKFRHVFGTAAKKEVGWDGVRISKNAWDSPFCSVNPLFIAIVLEAQGGGSFTVLNLDKPGRVDLNSPKVCGHTAAVLDLQFCPFNDYVIASCGEDCTVKVWEIPEGGMTKNISECVVDLVAHQRRVGIVEWHPTAENILASAGFDYMIYIWNVGTGENVFSIDCHTDTIYSVSWSYDGSCIATTSKDKSIRIINARSGEVVQTGSAHKGTKASRVVWTNEGTRLFTTGFSKMSERQYASWDAQDLSKPLKIENIDTSSGVLFIYYDEDTKMVYLAGKGDGNIRYYELSDEAPYVHYLTEYKTSSPQRGLGMLPKRGVNVGECEISRFYKLHPKGFVEPISFTVPRKATVFQADIFPETKEDAAVLSAEEWIAGETRLPNKFSLKGGYVQPERVALETTAEKAVEDTSGPPKGEKELLKAWHEHERIIKDLRAQLASAEIKIRTLEK